MIGKNMDLSELLYNPNALPQVQLNTGAQLGYEGGIRAPNIAAPVNMPVEQMAQQTMPQRTPSGELERDRALAEMLMQADSSPVYSPWQGLARVGEKIAGALIAKDANKKERANSAADREELARLRSGGGSPSAGAGGSSPTSAPDTDWLAVAATTQSPQVKAYAQGMYEQQKAIDAARLKAEFDIPSDVRMGMMGGLSREDAARQAFLAKTDPETIIPLPDGRIFHGRRSDLGITLGGDVPPPAAPDVLPPDFDFGDGGPASSAPGGFRG